MSIQAYQQTARRTENPREIEYRLFAQVTNALIEVKDLGRTDLGKLVDVLDWNKRIWSAFALDCANKENKLPDSLKAGIISLSIFVSKYTSQVIRENEDISELIDLNRTIMQGLAAQPGDPTTAENNGMSAA